MEKEQEKDMKGRKERDCKVNWRIFNSFVRRNLTAEVEKS